MGESKEKLVKILPHWEEHVAEHAKEFDTWADRLEEEGERKLAERLRKASLAMGNARLSLAEARVYLESGSAADDLALCAVCAWRETCQKRFTRDTGSPFRCPDFTRDVTLK